MPPTILRDNATGQLWQVDRDTQGTIRPVRPLTEQEGARMAQGLPLEEPSIPPPPSLLQNPLIKAASAMPIPALTTAGGTAGGAAVGSMLTPGVGTVIGGMLGAALGGVGGRKINQGLGLEEGDPTQFDRWDAITGAISALTPAALRMGGKMLGTTGAGRIVRRTMGFEHAQTLGKRVLQPPDIHALRTAFDHLDQMNVQIPTASLRKSVAQATSAELPLADLGLGLERGTLIDANQSLQRLPVQIPLRTWQDAVQRAGQKYRQFAKTVGTNPESAEKAGYYGQILNALDDGLDDAVKFGNLPEATRTLIQTTRGGYRRLMASEQVSALVDSAATQLDDGTWQLNLGQLRNHFAQQEAFAPLRKTLTTLKLDQEFAREIDSLYKFYKGGIVSMPAFIPYGLGAAAGTAIAPQLGVPAVVGTLAGAAVPEIVGELLLTKPGRFMLRQLLQEQAFIPPIITGLTTGSVAGVRAVVPPPPSR